MRSAGSHDEVERRPQGEARVRRERDLYRRLLALGSQHGIEAFLREALTLLVDVTSARLGYLELRDEPRNDVWHFVHGLSPEQARAVRDRVSSGIIAATLASGKLIETRSALLDARFCERASVKAKGIEAVICAPVGRDAVLGTVYLQGHGGGESFLREDVEDVEIVARHLAPLAERLLFRRRLACERDATRELRQRHRLDGVVGRSAALAEALGQAMLAAPLDVNVLLTGESGTGKSQLARLIHENGPRRAGPFVALNCAALPESLVESELFGAVAGGHSQARQDRPGKVAAAEKGTLFLDEVSELPVEAQAKLLQLLQARTYFPVGASRPCRADIRIVAATNTDLEAALRERRFREDLYYRLQVLPVRMPSLAERREDLPELARALVAETCERHGLAPVALSPAAESAVASAAWPGNVRQLGNALEAAVIRAHGRGAREITTSHVFPRRAAEVGDGDPAETFQEATRRFQRELLRRTLDAADWNVSEAARRLDLARSHTYDLIKAHELARP